MSLTNNNKQTRIVINGPLMHWENVCSDIVGCCKAVKRFATPQAPHAPAERPEPYGACRWSLGGPLEQVVEGEEDGAGQVDGAWAGAGLAAEVHAKF